MYKKLKLVLGLALVLGGGLVAGCAHLYPQCQQAGPAGLTLRIKVYPEQMDSLRIIPAFLVLSNGGSNPIRFTKLGWPIRTIGPGDNFDVTWLPCYVTSGGGLDINFVRENTEILGPGQSADWPFYFVMPTNRTCQITAHYNTLTSFPDAEKLCREADLWLGQLEAEPVTIRVDK